MKYLTSQWLEAASYDLLTIEKILDEEHLTGVVAFHAEQSIEKCFKAIMCEQEIEIEKIHDILTPRQKGILSA